MKKGTEAMGLKFKKRSKQVLERKGIKIHRGTKKVGKAKERNSKRLDKKSPGRENTGQ